MRRISFVVFCFGVFIFLRPVPHDFFLKLLLNYCVSLNHLPEDRKLFPGKVVHFSAMLEESSVLLRVCRNG